MLSRLFLPFLILLALPPESVAGTARVSRADDGTESNDHSWHPSISDDGDVIVFVSRADNLVADDDNGDDDIFVHVRSTGRTSRIVAPDGRKASGYTPPVISGDGRYVVFESPTDNLVADDSNGKWDIFVYDRQTGAIERVSIDSSGAESNGLSHSPNVSADGRFVTFQSFADNLAPNDTNGGYDVFVHDRMSGSTTRVNVARDGTEANEGVQLYWGWWNVVPISADGRYVAFNSPASNLVPGDTNGEEDVFVRDLLQQDTVRISVASDGTGANGWSVVTGMSADGRYLLFISTASNLAPNDDDQILGGNLFVHDRATKETWPINTGSDGKLSEGGVVDNACISGDGNHVAFFARSDALLPWVTSEAFELFVRDMSSGRTFRASMAYTGGEADSGRFSYSGCDVSNDGRYIAFNSSASNLIPGDRNATHDVFVTDNPAMFPITSGLNGSWFDPATNGQGFFIDVLPTAGVIFAGWLTFDVALPEAADTAQLGDPGHRWLSAQGEYLGNQAALDIHVLKGGVFDTSDPSPTVEIDGEMLVEFSSCRSGTITYNLPSIDRSRVIPIQRVALDNAVACESQAGEIITE